MTIQSYCGWVKSPVARPLGTCPYYYYYYCYYYCLLLLLLWVKSPVARP